MLIAKSCRARSCGYYFHFSCRALDVNELKYIVAHEIAHHQYQHYLYPNPKDAEPTSLL